MADRPGQIDSRFDGVEVFAKPCGKAGERRTLGLLQPVLAQNFIWHFGEDERVCRDVRLDVLSYAAAMC